jgi:hypothetical protein
MDSAQITNISNNNLKGIQLNNNNLKHLDNYNAARQEDPLINSNKPIRNNSFNTQNKNNTGNFKIINLKQKLEDQILFGKEKKHAHLVSNMAEQRSRPKNYELNNANTRTSKGKNYLFINENI